MAELIPLDYRLAMARKSLIERWGLVTIVAAAIAAAGVLSAYAWQDRQGRTLAELDAEYVRKTTLIRRGQELQAQRQSLAERMRRMQDLRDDKVLLSLLNNVSEVFSEADCLEYLRIDAHPTPSQAYASDKPPRDLGYVMRLRGITVSDTTHSKLLERLTEVGARSDTPIAVPLGEKRIEKYLDGEVTLYDITCEQAFVAGN